MHKMFIFFVDGVSECVKTKDVFCEIYTFSGFLFLTVRIHSLLLKMTNCNLQNIFIKYSDILALI